ncbi:MAG TPA: hypothetical protein VIV58_00965 [Kofleriaceae bacterium]
MSLIAKALGPQLGLMLGEERRDEAIKRAHVNAEAWCERIAELIRAMPPGTEFTTDDLWITCERLGLKIREPRAMGAAVRIAGTRGLVESTHTYRKSERPECHARPVLIWRRRG